jgi:hypothetical protein
MPTSPTLLIRQLPVAPHNTVTNSTLGLSFHRTLNVALESGECIDQAAVEDGNGAEGGS